MAKLEGIILRIQTSVYVWLSSVNFIDERYTKIQSLLNDLLKFPITISLATAEHLALSKTPLSKLSKSKSMDLRIWWKNCNNEGSPSCAREEIPYTTSDPYRDNNIKTKVNTNFTTERIYDAASNVNIIFHGNRGKSEHEWTWLALKLLNNVFI